MFKVYSLFSSFSLCHTAFMEFSISVASLGGFVFSSNY